MKNMKLRRMLYEDPVTGTNIAGHSNYQNPLMNLAINAGCFKEFGFDPTINQALGPGGEAFYKVSKDPSISAHPYVFLIPNPDGESFRASYRDNTGTEKDSQDKIYCKQTERTTNPVKTPDQQNVIDFLSNYGFKEYEAVKGKDMLQYTLVDIAKDPEVTGTLMKDNALLRKFITQDSRTFWMWKSNSLVSGYSAEVENKGATAQDIIKLAKNKGLLTYNELITQEDTYNYEPVDLSKPEAYTGILAGLGDGSSRFKTPVIMYRPKGGLKGVQTLRGDAKKYLDFFTGKTMGWQIKSEIDPSELSSAEWEWVDLSKPEQYSGNLYEYRGMANNFPPGFIIGKKVNISLGEGGALNEESCRQVIINYYDEMMANKKQAPSLSDKRRVETCLKTFRGRYPKLKAQIEKLVIPPNTRDSYRVEYGDYTTAPNLRTKLGMGKDITIPTGQQNKTSAVQQESKDKLLKNIISENLLKLKKKQLLERTLSSKNTYRY